MLNKVLAKHARAALEAEIAKLRYDYMHVEEAVEELFKEFGLRSVIAEPSVYYEQSYYSLDKVFAALVEVVFPNDNRLVLAAVYGYDYRSRPSPYRFRFISPVYVAYDAACHCPDLSRKAPTSQLFPLIALAAAFGEEDGALSLNAVPRPRETTIAYSITVEGVEGQYSVWFGYGIHGGRQYGHQHYLRRLLIGTARDFAYDITVTPTAVREFIDDVKAEAAVQLLSWG